MPARCISRLVRLRAPNVIRPAGCAAGVGRTNFSGAKSAQIQIHTVTIRNTSFSRRDGTCSSYRRANNSIRLLPKDLPCVNGSQPYARSRSLLDSLATRGRPLIGRARTPVSGVLLGTLLAACAVGPDYKPPQLPTPDEWHALPQRGVKADSPDSSTLASWWTVLNDPTLNGLVERALAENRTVKQAMARVVESRARRSIATSVFWPNIGASAGASRSDSDASGSNAGPTFSGGSGETYDAGVDAGWELDLFGGNRRALEASTAQLGASEADLRDVLVTLLGDVTLSYVNVR